MANFALLDQRITMARNHRVGAGVNPMPGKFVIAEKTEVKIDDFGTSSWLSNPPTTGCQLREHASS